MQGYAIEFQAAFKAGLQLAGVGEYGEPEWLGTKEKWSMYRYYLALHDQGIWPVK